MKTITINLPTECNVTKGPKSKAWLAQCIRDLSPLADFPDLCAEIFYNGWKSYVADAASGATTEAEAIGMMEKKADALLRGEKVTRGAASGVTDEQIALVNLVAGILSGDKRKDFNGKPLADRVAIADKNAGKFTAEQVADEIARIVRKREERAAEKAALEALRGDIEIDF